MIEALHISESAAYVVTWLLQAVVFGTVLAGITWLLTRIALRGARPVVHAAFWMVVLAKFVLPVGPGFDYSLSSLVGPFAQLAPPTETQPPAAPTGYVLVDVAVAPLALGGSMTDAQANMSAQLMPTATDTSAGGAGIDWMLIIAAAYLAGVLVVAGIRIASYRRFVARCAQLPLAGRGVHRLVAMVCRQSSVRTVPLIRLSDQAPAPFVYGLFAPTLVLSSTRTLARDELETVLLHEIAHLRRFDLLTRHLQWLAGTLLFFWPIVAWVNRRIDLAREYACDEWALRHGRLRPGQYARCLLRAATPVKPSLFAYRPAAMATNVTHVERRIEMIMNQPKRGPRARGISLLAGAALIAWSGFALTGAAPIEEVKDNATVDEQVWVTDGGQTMDLDGRHAMLIANTDGAQQVFMKTIDMGGQPGMMTAVFNRQLSEGALAEFGAAHPNADANGDGNFSRNEHDAYMVALAMARPEAVIAQFPHADGDNDGALSAIEAANLLNGGAPHGLLSPGANARFGTDAEFSDNMHIRHAAHAAQFGSDPLVQVEEFDNGDGNVFVRKMVVNADVADTDMNEFQTIDVDVVADSEASWHSTAVIRIDDGSGVKERVVQLESPDGASHAMKINAESVDGKMVIRIGEGDDAQVIELNKGEGEWQVEGDDAELPEDVQAKIDAIRETIGLEDGEGEATFEWTTDAPLGPDGEPMELHFAHSFTDTAGWLLENIDASPSSEEVASYVVTVRDAPLANFMKVHPEADTDGDGAISKQERDAYLEGHMSKVRQRMIERYPDADANKDGVLTNEELREYFRAHGPQSGEHKSRFKVISNHGGSDGDAIHKAVIRETSDE